MKRSSRNVLYVFFGLICVALVAQMLTAVSGATLSSRSSSPSLSPPSSSSSVGAASGGVAMSTSADLSDTCTAWSSNESSFNPAPIAEGNVIWFNSAIRVNGLGSDPASLFLNDSTITFAADGKIYNLAVPGATITFDPAATAATTSFDDAGNRWKTTVPSGLSGRAFLSGLAFRVPDGGLPGGLSSVTWSAALSTDTHGLTTQWQWGAEVYTKFATDYNALAVKPVDDDLPSQRTSLIASQDGAGQNDSVGKPANPDVSLTAGAGGDGSSDFTESPGVARVGTSNVTPCTEGFAQPRNNTWTTITLATRGNAGRTTLARGMGSTKSCPSGVLPSGTSFQCTFTMQNLDSGDSITGLAVHNNIPDPLNPSCPSTVPSSTSVSCLVGGIPVTTLSPAG